MSEARNKTQWTPFGNKRILIALISIGIAITLMVALINGDRGRDGAASPTTHGAAPTISAAIDAAAQGEMAAFRATAHGTGYPEIRFVAESGETVGFDYFSGKVTLVNFWATWCAPCRAEMPALDALHAKYAERNFQVATINMDVGRDGLQKARAFMDEAKLKHLPLHADPSFAAFEVLRTRGVALGLPATILLGPDGHEWGVLAGPAEWDGDDAHRLVAVALAQATR